jgi:hypothetical protein
MHTLDDSMSTTAGHPDRKIATLGQRTAFKNLASALASASSSTSGVRRMPLRKNDAE